MHWHERKARLQRQTALLVVLFLSSLPVAGAFVGGACVGGAWLLGLGAAAMQHWPMLWLVSTVAVGSVAIASAWAQELRLRKEGGGVLLARVQGVPVARLEGFAVRRLENVVHEMAIAAMLPAPKVYVLPARGINAVSTGLSPQQAAIGVTQGALHLLSRRELQAVIAHELAHILHGDIRLHSRLAAMVGGLRAISDAGIALVARANRQMRRRQWMSAHDARAQAFALGFGALLALAGAFSAVLGDLLQRAILRRRELMADDEAVRLLRDPMALADALKAIAAFAHHARLAMPQAAFLRHALFADSAEGWWSTHPPLIKRIHRLDPTFRPERLAVELRRRPQRAQDLTDEALASSAKPDAQKAFAGDVAAVQGVQALLEALSPQLRLAARDPYLARALWYALLLDARPAVRARQWRLLEKAADPAVLAETHRLAAEVMRLDARLRLVLAEQARAALDALSAAQKTHFVRCMQALIHADRRVRALELFLYRLAVGWPRPSASRWSDAAEDASVVLYAIAAAEAGSRAQAEQRARKALAKLGIDALPPGAKRTIGAFDRALTRLRGLPDARKEVLLDAARGLLAHAKTHPEQDALWRALCIALSE